MGNYCSVSVESGSNVGKSMLKLTVIIVLRRLGRGRVKQKQAVKNAEQVQAREVDLDALLVPTKSAKIEQRLVMSSYS
jgi:hypothetical protein